MFNQLTPIAMSKKQRLEVTVKDTVDFMYEMLIQHPEGIEFNASSLGNTPTQVVSLLAKRNIIERTPLFSKYGRKFRYKWVATMAPTKVLYGSIAQELRALQSAYNKVYHEKRQKQSCPVEEHKPEVKPDVKPIPEEDVKALEELKKTLEEPAIIHEGPLTPIGFRVNAPKVSLTTETPKLEIYGIDELWAEIKRRGCFIEDNKLVLVKKIVFD